jgi:hypothetical protein
VDPRLRVATVMWRWRPHRCRSAAGPVLELGIAQHRDTKLWHVYAQRRCDKCGDDLFVPPQTWETKAEAKAIAERAKDLLEQHGRRFRRAF